MPELSKDLVALLAYLLPGFLVAWIFYALTSHQKPIQFERVIQALIFTLLVSGLVVFERLGFEFVGKWRAIRPWDKDVELLASIISAIGLGLGVARLANNDKLHEWLRKKKISQRSSHPSEWCTVFVALQTYVVIEFKDGRRLYGWPEVWPSNFERGHIFITEPSWIHENSQVQMPHTEGILVPVADIARVEFAKRPENPK